MIKNGFQVFISIFFLLNISIINCSITHFNENVDKNQCESCDDDKTSYIKKDDGIFNRLLNKIGYNNNEKKEEENALFKDVANYNKEKYNENDRELLNNENTYRGIERKEENEETNGDIQKYFMNFKKKEDYYDFYILKLNEFNFRWSISFDIGSKKTPMELSIITTSPITALYCTNNSREKDEMKKLKYDINQSEDLRYVECRSKNCEHILNSECLPLENYFKMLHDYNIRKKSCKKKFCDYVNNMNFLDMNNKLNDKNISVCSFHSTLGDDQVKGFYFKDSFYIHKTIKCSYDYFGCIAESDYLKFNEVLSGFIGLGNYNEDDNKEYPSILNSFVEKSISKKNMFALCFIEKGGLVSFGGYEKSILKKKNDKLKKSESDEQIEIEDNDIYDILWLHYSNPNKIIYSIFLKEINAKSKSKKLINAINKDAIVDSYNYFLSIPAEITAKIKVFVYDECSEQTNECSKLVEKGTFKLDNKTIQDFPKIELVFNEGILIIEPNDYLIHEGDGLYRILVNTSGVLKLGIPFFLNKYLIFDNDNKKLGISRSDCNFNIAGETTGIDINLNEIDVKETGGDYDIVNQGFFQKNKIVIITILILCLVASIIGSIFYFC